MSNAQVLQQVPLFGEIPPEDLERLAAVARARTYPKNNMVLFKDDVGDALFVVASGQVKVVLTGEDGREVILAVLGPGAFFGEMALIDDEPRSANVIAMEQAQLLVLQREEFRAALRRSPDIAWGLLRELTRRLRRADATIGNLVLKDVSARVAHLLLELAEDDDGTVITRRLTHATIAQMIGSSRETVSRTMRELQSEQLIEVGRQAIVLKDRRALEVIANP